MDTREDTRTAYHEAGHVLAAWEALYCPAEATIDPGPKGEAWIQLGLVHQNKPHTGRGMSQLDAMALISLAGMVAESVWQGTPQITDAQRTYHGTDWHKAQEYAKERCLTAPECKPYLQWLELRARTVLKHSWDILQELAEELLRKRTLDQDALWEFIQRHRAFHDASEGCFYDEVGSRTKNLMSANAGNESNTPG